MEKLVLEDRPPVHRTQSSYIKYQNRSYNNRNNKASMKISILLCIL